MKKSEQLINQIIENQGVNFLNDLQVESLARLRENGFPTPRQENWKYTNPKFIHQVEYKTNNDDASVDEKFVKDHLINIESSEYIVLINGRINKELSNYNSDTIIQSFTDLNQSEQEFIKESYSKEYSDKHNFRDLNNSFNSDGLYIELLSNNKIINPIQILNIIDSSKEAVILNSRFFFKLASSASATVSLKNITFGSNDSFINNLNHIHLDKAASFDFYQIQNDISNSNLVNFTQCFQDKDSRFYDNTITLNGSLVRNDLRTELNGEYSEAYYNGVYLSDEKSLFDNHTFVDHAVPNCHSNEFYKGIMDDNSKAIFNGKVLVRKDAQKTDAYQQNRNIVLTDTASINTKPELEIYADDVKCSHGATTGKIDMDALFYMRQRGLDEKMAKSLLMYTFCHEVLERMKNDEFKNYFSNLIHYKLGV